MDAKVLANDEDITDLLHMELQRDVFDSVVPPLFIRLYAFADKANWVIQRCRKLGTFRLQFYAATGQSAAYTVAWVPMEQPPRLLEGVLVVAVLLRVVDAEREDPWLEVDRENAWHFFSGDRHHRCLDCRYGDGWGSDAWRPGTGGQPLCQECRRLIARGI